MQRMSMSDDSTAKLLILSYHSWDIAPETLIGDIQVLREAGWRDLTLEAAHRYISGDASLSGMFFLVTSDDSSEKDGEFVSALRQAGCPGVLFINIGNIHEERLPFYRQLVKSQDIAVQDHGRFHRKQFISGQVYDYADPGSYLGGLEHLNLEPGMPICIAGSEIAAPRFIPAGDALALAAETSRSLFPGVTKEERNRFIESTLIRKGRGYRRLGRFYLRGEFELDEDYSRRVFHYLADGKKEFEERLGRSPDYHAYTWWQGSRAADKALEKLGYKGSFSGTGHLQGQDGRMFGIPRVAVDSGTPRPLRLENITMRPLKDITLGSSLKKLGKAALGIR